MRQCNIFASLLCRHRFNLFRAVDAHVEIGKQDEVVAHLLNGVVDHGRNNEKCEVDERRHVAALQQPRTHEDDRWHAQLEQHHRKVGKGADDEFAAHKRLLIAFQPLVEAAAIGLLTTV